MGDRAAGHDCQQVMIYDEMISMSRQAGFETLHRSMAAIPPNRTLYPRGAAPRG